MEQSAKTDGPTKQGDAALRKAEQDRGVKVARLMESNHIEAFFLTFERLMRVTKYNACVQMM